MSKLVRLFTLLIVIFIASITQAQECNISKNDINSLIEGLKNSNLPLRDKGFFIDLQSPSFL